MSVGFAPGFLQGTPRGGTGNGVMVRSRFNQTYPRGDGWAKNEVAELSTAHPNFYNMGALPGYTTHLSGLESISIGAPRRPSVGLGGVALYLTGNQAPGATIKRPRYASAIMGVDFLLETGWTFTVAPGSIAANSQPFNVVIAPNVTWNVTPGVNVGIEYWAATFNMLAGATNGWTGVKYGTTIVNGPASFSVATCSFSGTSKSVTTTASFSAVKVGYGVVGTGIPVGTYVAAVTSSTHITLSNTSTSGESGESLTFYPTLGPSSHAIGIQLAPTFGAVPNTLTGFQATMILPANGHMTAFTLITTGCTTSGATVGTATGLSVSFATTANYANKWGIKSRFSNFFAHSSIFGATWPATNTTPPKCAVTIRGAGNLGALGFRKTTSAPTAPPATAQAMFAYHGATSGHTFIVVRSHGGGYNWWNLNTHSLGHGTSLPT